MLASAPIVRSCVSSVRVLRPYASLHRYRTGLSGRARRAASTQGSLFHGTDDEGGRKLSHDEALLSIEANARQARLRYGSSLPSGLLSQDEYQVYERLYGPPVTFLDAQELAETDAIDPSLDSAQSLDIDEALRHQELFTVEDQLVEEEEPQDEEESEEEPEEDEDFNEEESESEDHNRWLDRQRAEEHYSALEESQPSPSFRTHPLTKLGRFGDARDTIILPEETLAYPSSQILSQLSNKHIQEIAHQKFGSRLEDSVATPMSTGTRHLEQKAPPLTALQTSMGPTEAGVFIACNMPGMYASTMTALLEIRKRLGSPWLERLLHRTGGPRILDVGSAGAAVVAWREMLQAEWSRMHPDKDPDAGFPHGKSTVVAGAAELTRRVSTFSSDTTFLPRLPDFDRMRDLPGSEAFDPSARKHYDIVVSSHALWNFGEDWERKAHVQNLWSLLDPKGGVLLLIEKGVPRGFELVGGARQTLLDYHIHSNSTNGDSSATTRRPRMHKEDGMIVAPCTNHNTCPMYRTHGAMKGRRDWCRFEAHFARPEYLHRLHGPRAATHERLRFSFVAVQRGLDRRQTERMPQDEEAATAAFKGFAPESTEPVDTSSPHPLSLPRLILPPLKKRGHVLFDVCTPAAKIERWIVPKSHSKQAFHDARKARWGDLWALGAKTRVERVVRSGSPKTKAPSQPTRKDRSKQQRISAKRAARDDRDSED